MSNMNNNPNSFYPQICLYLGIIGAIGFIHMVLVFLEDHSHRFEYLVYFIPLPIILLILAKFFPRISGLMLIFLGAAATAFDFLKSPSSAGQIGGRGVGYTFFFSALPLILSGFFYIRKAVIQK